MSRNKRIKDALRGAGITQEQLADYLCITQAAVGKQLNKEDDIDSIEFIRAVADLCELDFTTLVQGQEPNSGEITDSERGYSVYRFKDSYANRCSIQESSADGSFIWFGIESYQPMIEASRAATFGIQTDQRTGWVPYPIPPAVIIPTRMHLSVEQVMQLIPILQRFVETGQILETDNGSIN